MIMNLFNRQLNKDTNDNLTISKTKLSESKVILSSEEISIIENLIKNNNGYFNSGKPYAWK